MFEGKEFETKIGNYGTASVDVTKELKVKVEVGLEIDLLDEIKKLAKKTDTKLDDQAIAWIEQLIKTDVK